MTTNHRVAEIESILRKSRQGQRFSVEHIILGHQSDFEDAEIPPPFGGTLVSPPDHPIRVYVGGVSEAMYPAALIERNIVGIINVAFSQCIESQRIMKMSLESNSQWDKIEFSEKWYRSNLGNPDFKYLGISAEDHTRYKIAKHFNECIDFVDSIQQTAADNDSLSRPGVLVHCMQGYNRSVAVCVAWLMRACKFSLSEAVSRISEQRPLILSNRAFIRELVQFEESDEKDDVVREIDQEIKTQTFSIGEIVERIYLEFFIYFKFRFHQRCLLNRFNRVQLISIYPTVNPHR